MKIRITENQLRKVINEIGGYDDKEIITVTPAQAKKLTQYFKKTGNGDMWKKLFQGGKGGAEDQKSFDAMVKSIKEDTNDFFAIREARRNAANDTYFDTYSAAVQKAKADAEKKGYEVDEDDWHNQITTGPGKPGRGKTVRHNIKLNKNGKPTKKGLAIQVYNRDTDRNTYELNSYVS